jgi:hypothetical protein
VTRCNLEASEEIARQLRLRDIGGMVMIDYVDMVMPANRDLVLRRLVECLARDRTKHQVAEVTSLGLVQMTRKRIGQGLVEAFSEECPTCKGRGFILHDEPTVSADYDDPYAMKGGDPFVAPTSTGMARPKYMRRRARPRRSRPSSRRLPPRRWLRMWPRRPRRVWRLRRPTRRRKPPRSTWQWNPPWNLRRNLQATLATPNASSRSKAK